MKCKRCHRKLKDPESIKLGYGPVCYEKEFGASMQKKRVQTSQDSNIEDQLPGQMSIWDYMENDSAEKEPV